MNTQFKYEDESNTFSTVPSRNFRFVVDPDAVGLITEPSRQGVVKLINDLNHANCGINLKFILPSYLSKTDQSILKTLLGDSLIVVDEEIENAIFAPKGGFSKRDLDKLSTDANKAHNFGLLAFAVETQADGIITTSDVLIELRWTFRALERIRIIPPEELGDIIEIIAHGNNLFWSAQNPDRGLTVDRYYVIANSRCNKYYNYSTELSKQNSEKSYTPSLHNALLNRYPFLNYARDLVQFYDLQLDYYSRRDLYERFNFPRNYHITNFYLLLWGMLDQLTIIAKHACNLDIRDRDCGIKKSKFLSKLGPIRPDLKNFIEIEISDWISNIADIRHQAARQTIKLPTRVLERTEDSQKEEEIIRKELKQKYPEFYAYFPSEYIKNLEPIWINNWRISHMRCIRKSSVYITKENGQGYFRDPVVSLDYNLNTLTEIMDKFLQILFGYPKLR